jgi:hypothetical protein
MRAEIYGDEGKRGRRGRECAQLSLIYEEPNPDIAQLLCVGGDRKEIIPTGLSVRKPVE